MHWLARSADETEALGERLARAYLPQPGHGVLYLRGELGAGKTTLARGLLRGCGVTAPVRSPTYSLVELYAAGALTLVHVDLYRLQSPAELESLGLRDYAAPAHLWLVEWPERGAGLLPPPDLTLSFTVGSSGHEIDPAPGSATGTAWLARLRQP